MTRYLGIAKATTWGSAVAITDFIEIINETLSENHALIVAEDVPNRSSQKQLPGRFGVEGDVVFNPRPDNVGQILAWLLGSDTVSQPDPVNAPNTYSHKIKQADDLPIFTAEVGLDNPSNIGVKKYDSMMADTVRISHDPEGMVEITATLRGRSVDISGAPLTPSFSTLMPFVFHMGQFKIAGTANGDVEGVTININNNLQAKMDENSRFVGKYKPGLLVVEGSFDISFENMDQFKRFLGKATATTPQNVIEEVSFEAIYTSYEAIEGAFYYKLAFNMPKIVYSVHRASIDRRSRIVEGIDFRALRDPTEGSPIIVEVVNKDSAAYA